MRKQIDRNWYKSKNVRPKAFNIEVERTPNGGYRIIQGNIINVINQHAFTIQRVDARELFSDIVEKGISVL